MTTNLRNAAGSAALALAFLAAATAANAEDWKVVQSSGDVWIASNSAQPVALSSTTDVPDGATLTTGDAGRVMLMRGEQTMLVGPDTIATVPLVDDQKFVTVLQRTGRIEFDVDRQKDPHFAVETPFLAAVVKGTHFVVTVGDSSANVAVDRGLVNVTDLATGDVADTPAGQRASIASPGARLAVDGSGPLAEVFPGAPRAPLVQRISADELRAFQQNGGTGGSLNLDGHGTQAAAAGGLAVIAGNSGGDDSNGGSGGSPITGSGDGASPAGGGNVTGFSLTAGDAGKLAQDALSIEGNGGGFTTHRQSVTEGSTTLVVAVVLGLSVMLAFGFAFLRGRAS